MCRSRQELFNAYFLAKFGFDTADHLFVPLRYLQFLKIVRSTAAAAENEPCEVCPLSAYRSPRCGARLADFDAAAEAGARVRSLQPVESRRELFAVEGRGAASVGTHRAHTRVRPDQRAGSMGQINGVRSDRKAGHGR